MHDDKELIERDIEGYLEQHQNKELLRFVSVGSVDDGKSTLIGRLLHDTHGIYEDQLAAVERASSQKGSSIDLALLTDGLKAEREQGITIDVAYRYFSTARRKFIIADTPGHVQYTRNMATGASTADVAIILIDARHGVLQQSRRHAYIANLLGIPRLVTCVNKMDLASYSEDVFRSIRGDFERFAERLAFEEVTFIPISALGGDNVVHASDRMPWYQGPTLLEFLETVPIGDQRSSRSFRYPVQYVLRPHLDYRGFAGEISSGQIRKGDSVLVLPSRRASRVKAIDTFDGELDEAFAPMSVTLRLEDEVDVSRGDMLVKTDDVPHVAQQFDAMMVWMSEARLDSAKSYLLKHTTQMVRAEVAAVRHHVDLESLEDVGADGLGLNDIARVTLRAHRPLYFDAYRTNRSTGAFILIDSISNNTVAAGMILDPVRSGSADMGEAWGTHSQVSARERRARLGQSGAVVWLSAAKADDAAALAYAVERQLFDGGHVAVVASAGDSVERESATLAASTDLARRLADAGLVAIFARSAPTRADRATIASGQREGTYFEVSVHRSGAAAAGAFEAPTDPALTVDLDVMEVEVAAARVVDVLTRSGLFDES
jgi:bifunctional enzyme CysN/CysC